MKRIHPISCTRSESIRQELSSASVLEPVKQLFDTPGVAVLFTLCYVLDLLNKVDNCDLLLMFLFNVLLQIYRFEFPFKSHVFALLLF